MTETLQWPHWRDAVAEWDNARWPNFSPRELACKGTGRLVVHAPSLDALQALRTRLGKPLLLTSAYRSPEHNRAVDGAKQSQHLLGRAFDVRMDNQFPRVFEMLAKDCGFTGIGHYPRDGFMHVDTGEGDNRPAKWNKGGWFKPSESGLPAEPAPPRKAEAARDAAISAGAILAGGEVVQATLREVGGVAPASWAPWLFGAAALVGGGVALWRIFGRRSAEPEA